MKARLCLVVIALLTVNTLSAQKQFNPNNVLVISKEVKKRPMIMSTGTRVKCKLQNGEKARGTLYVYVDHIVVDDQEVNFSEILKVKRISPNAVIRQAGAMGLDMYRRDLAGRPLVNNTYLITSGIFAAINFTKLDRWYSHDNGWEFKVEELGSPFALAKAVR